MNIPTKCARALRQPQDALVHLAWEGAAARYPDGIPDTYASHSTMSWR
jgi:hypothetical protein